MHQPGQKRRGDEVDQDRMRIPAMPGELGDFVEKRVNENVEVGERSDQTAPKNGPIAELPAEANLADRAAESNLRYGVHGSAPIAQRMGRVSALPSRALHRSRHPTSFDAAEPR